MTISDLVSLHDGVLKKISIDFEKKRVVIDLIGFLKQSSKQKESIQIDLGGVDKLSMTLNLDQLDFMANHGGNINDWMVESGMTVNIDCTGGYAIFSAADIKLNDN